jgi:hypothetical protein
MNPLIAIAAQVFPQILKTIAGDSGGTVEKQVVQPAAIAAFQTMSGLVVDGDLASQTATALGVTI